MALIKCTECGKDISDKASACPNCGCPIDVVLSESQRVGAKVEKEQQEKNRQKTMERKAEIKYKKQLLLFFGILIAIILSVSTFYILNKHPQSNTQTDSQNLSKSPPWTYTPDPETVLKQAEEKAKRTKRITQIKYEINELRKQLIRKVDNVENITWLHSKLTPNLNIISGNVLQCYVGERGGSAWLRVRYGFSQADWVFMDKIIFNIDGAIIEIPVPYSDRKTDINDGIAEWIDMTVEPKDIDFLQFIANSKKTLVKFRGDTAQKSFTVTQNQKSALKQILKYYLLKEELSQMPWLYP